MVEPFKQRPSGAGFHVLDNSITKNENLHPSTERQAGLQLHLLKRSSSIADRIKDQHNQPTLMLCNAPPPLHKMQRHGSRCHHRLAEHHNTVTTWQGRKADICNPGATTSIHHSYHGRPSVSQLFRIVAFIVQSKRDFVLLINDKDDELWLRFLLYVDQ